VKISPRQQSHELFARRFTRLSVWKASVPGWTSKEKKTAAPTFKIEAIELRPALLPVSFRFPRGSSIPYHFAKRSKKKNFLSHLLSATQKKPSPKNPHSPGKRTRFVSKILPTTANFCLRSVTLVASPPRTSAVRQRLQTREVFLKLSTELSNRCVAETIRQATSQFASSICRASENFPFFERAATQPKRALVQYFLLPSTTADINPQKRHFRRHISFFHAIAPSKSSTAREL